MLDGEARRVARGEDVLAAAHASMQVDRDEAAVVARQPADPRPDELGQRDDHVRAHAREDLRRATQEGSS